MLARTRTFTIEGLQTRPVTVEVDIRPGLPAFAIVGLADASVREARERVQAAIWNSGYEFPAQRITVNLAPGDRAEGRPGIGPGAGVRGAGGERAVAAGAPCRRTRCSASWRSTVGAGSARERWRWRRPARRSGIATLVLAARRAHEAMLVEGLAVAAAQDLRSTVRVLSGGPPDPLPRAGGSRA